MVRELHGLRAGRLMTSTESILERLLPPEVEEEDSESSSELSSREEIILGVMGGGK